MKLNHYIYIKVKTRNKNRILLKLYKNRINVYEIVEKKDALYLKILKDDYQRVKDKIVTAKFYYVNDAGIFHLQKQITPIKVMIFVGFLLFVNFFSRIIVSVEVIHSNKEIRDLVTRAVEDQGIKVWSLKKDYAQLQEIKNQILSSYKDQLEWLEIENVGMKYIVRIEERILNPQKEEKTTCHIVASKSGIVSSLHTTKGESLVHEGSYVSEGDILISGEIKYNEEVKNNVCAAGDVFAEVWYSSVVHLPIDYKVSTRTGKKRYNLAIEMDSGKYKIFRSRLATYETEEKVLFHFFNFTFYQFTEYETNENTYQYDLETGEKEAIRLGDEKINFKLNDGEKIQARKVLKKSINDSTIDVELFYAVIENIGVSQEYSIPEEEGSSDDSGDSE